LARWTIDLDLKEIRDDAGQHLVLRRHAVDVLFSLASQHDRLVPKDDLIAEHWPHVVVTDNSLTKVISEIRAALGNGSRHTIRTVSGRGYMLTGWHRDGSILHTPPLPRPMAGQGAISH
jgi:DNA-binding winged helix-turn-helix (wHTH) protein